jgi:hypothetical protein
MADCCLSLPIKRWCVAWPFVTSQGHKAAIKNALVNAIVKPSKFLCRYGLVFRFFDLTARLNAKTRQGKSQGGFLILGKLSSGLKPP